MYAIRSYYAFRIIGLIHGLRAGLLPAAVCLSRVQLDHGNAQGRCGVRRCAGGQCQFGHPACQRVDGGLALIRSYNFV